MRNTESGAAWGSLIAFLSGLTLNEWAAIFGILFGLFTILLNWYYKEREIRLKEKELEKLAELKGAKNA